MSNEPDIYQNLIQDNENKEELLKDNDLYSKIREEESFQKGLKRIISIFKSLPKDQRALVMPLAERSAFLKVTLEKLEADILDQGTVEVYQNGKNQYGLKMSTRLKTYVATLNAYTSLQGKLMRFLPVSQPSGKIDKLIRELEKSV